MRQTVLVMISLVLAMPAHADVLAEMKTCATVSDDTARLACFDRAIIAIDAKAAQAAKDRTVAAAVKAKADAAKAEADRIAETARLAQAKKDSFGAEQLAATQHAKDISDVKQLDAVISQVLTNALGDLTLVLDNGQIWQQTESASLPPIRSGDPVHIKKGVIGGFRLTFIKQGRTVSVKRFR